MTYWEPWVRPMKRRQTHRLLRVQRDEYLAFPPRSYHWHRWWGRGHKPPGLRVWKSYRYPDARFLADARRQGRLVGAIYKDDQDIDPWLEEWQA